MEGIPNILGFIDSSVQECLHEGGGEETERQKEKKLERLRYSQCSIERDPCCVSTLSTQ
jgi:hypothetical protein